MVVGVSRLGKEIRPRVPDGSPLAPVLGTPRAKVGHLRQRGRYRIESASLFAVFYDLANNDAKQKGMILRREPRLLTRYLANSRCRLSFQRLLEARCFLVSSGLGSPAAVAEGGRWPRE